MKLSNKILIGFFGFIFLYLTSVFAELRFSGTSRILDAGNSTAETVDLPGIRHIVLDNVDKEIYIIGSDRSALEIRSFTGGLLTKLKYNTSGDSLKVSAFEAKKAERVKISVFVSKTDFKGVTVNEANAFVEGLQQDVLHISLKAGRIWMTNNRITRLYTDLSSQSFLNIDKTSIDTLQVEAEDSEAHIFSPVGFLQGSLKSKSVLRLNNVSEIQLKRDEESRLNIF